MAAIDFPASPTLNQTFTAPNGVIYQWDSVKWVVAFAPSGMVAFKSGAANAFGMAQWTGYTPTFGAAAYNNGGGLFDGTSYTVKTAGLYQVFFKSSLTIPAAGSFTILQCEANTYVNNTMVDWNQFNEPYWAGPMSIPRYITYMSYFAVNDFINFRVQVGNANGVNYHGGSLFSVTRLGS